MSGPLALLAVPAMLAAVPVADAWQATTSPDGVITATTPCNAADMARMARIPEDALGTVRVAAHGRVLCRKGKLLLLTGRITEPTLSAGSALFDTLVAGVRADATTEGAPRRATVDGSRAFFNRQAAGEMVAQTGFIEVDRTSVVLVLAAVEVGSGLSAAERVAMVDRFASSVRIARR